MQINQIYYFYFRSAKLKIGAKFEYETETEIRNPKLKRITNRNRPLSKNKICITMLPNTQPIKLETITLKRNKDKSENQKTKEKMKNDNQIRRKEANKNIKQQRNKYNRITQEIEKVFLFWRLLSLAIAIFYSSLQLCPPFVSLDWFFMVFEDE